MGYSIKFHSFSVTLIMTLCFQSIKSVRAWNPELDDDCISVESVQKEDNTWNREDRVFVCQISQSEFDIYSYEKNETVAYFSSTQVSFKEMSHLSVSFTVNEGPFSTCLRCTFSQIELAQEFFKRTKPIMSLFSPHNFVLRKLEKCNVVGGHCENRKIVTIMPLIFHQRFIDRHTMKFTFEPANKESAKGIHPFEFRQNEYQLRVTCTKVLLVHSNNPSLYYILDFGNSRSNYEFVNYAVAFSNYDFDIAIPEELRA